MRGLFLKLMYRGEDLNRYNEEELSELFNEAIIGIMGAMFLLVPISACIAETSLTPLESGVAIFAGFMFLFLFTVSGSLSNYTGMKMRDRELQELNKKINKERGL